MTSSISRQVGVTLNASWRKGFLFRSFSAAEQIMSMLSVSARFKVVSIRTRH